MIAIIDYGLGNVLAFANLYKRINVPATVARTPDQLRVADRLILPGVGAFDHAMERLEASGMRPALEEAVRVRGVPVLGICVGMQILAPSSEEGTRPGLGWIEGGVKRFDPATLHQRTRLPHMGWNDVKPVGAEGLFRGLELDSRFYFLHSYYFLCAHRANVLAETDYGVTFASAVSAGNVYGVQFHPEKSHQFGTQLLKNFSEI